MTTERPSDHADTLAIEHLRALVRIPTISRSEAADVDWAQFEAFIAALAVLYPGIHAALELERVGGYSLLYRWRGTSAASPTVLMAHYDVVPATDEGWDHPPFSAHVTGEVTDAGDGREMWGRGTLDDKGSLTCILEAVERAVVAGVVPRNDVYLSFGHDEETFGGGASQVVDLLESRGIRPALVVDEGGAVVDGVFPGVDSPIAVVGVTEKGILNLTLTVRQDGGHASTPPRMPATVRLARAITRLNSHQFPAALGSTNREMISTLAAHSRGALRFAARAQWLTAPILTSVFSRLSDETAAIVRTTQVVTTLSGSQAANALAETATATVNIRIAVGSTVARTIEHVRRAIRDDKVIIAADRASEPSPVSPTVGFAWNAVTRAIAASYPEAIVTPYVMLAASDSRHFTRISTQVYRFSPFAMSTAERGTLHAKNERMHIASFLRGIGFFETLIADL